MKIGFIGTGIMGSRMAANLLKEDYDVLVYNRTKEHAQELVDQGAEWVNSPASLAERVEVLITMLSNPEAVEEVMLGERGGLMGMSKASLWVDCSTVGQSFARKMAAEAGTLGVRYMDAPVAGSKGPAENGELVFLAGGKRDDLKDAQPLFELMGKEVQHIGEPGKGNAMKMCVNLMLGHSMAAFAEAVSLGEGLGIDQDKVLDLLSGSAVAAPFLGTKKDKLKSQDYSVEFPLKWMLKDLGLASSEGYRKGVPMPGTANVQELFALARKENGEKDFSSIYEFLASRRLKEE